MSAAESDLALITFVFVFVLHSLPLFLFLLGNYCPVCHKCYADDDWESKMVQCAICEAWVHAKCEGLNGESYNGHFLVIIQVFYNPNSEFIFLDAVDYKSMI